jgi:hypothetical protein
MTHAHYSHRALERAEAGTPPPTPREVQALAAIDLQNDIVALANRISRLRQHKTPLKPTDAATDRVPETSPHSRILVNGKYHAHTLSGQWSGFSVVGCL